MNWRFQHAKLTDFDPVPEAAARWLAEIVDDSQFIWQPSDTVAIGPCPECNVEMGERKREQFGVACHSCSAKVSWDRLQVVEHPELRVAWDGSGEGILIVGAVGVGKTHLAAALCNDLDEHSVATSWCAGTDLAWRARIAIGRQDAEDPYHAAARFNGVLILDDIGAIKYMTAAGEPTHAHDGIAHVLRRRYDHLMPTILTAHQSLSMLAEHVGIGIASRLQQMFRVELDGEDRRALQSKAS